MILLPFARAAYLKSFSLTLALLSGLAIAVLWYSLQLPVQFSFVAVPAVGFPLLGLIRPKIMSKPYRLWDALANYFARGARLVLLGVCFYIIMVAVRFAGAAIELGRPSADQSLWISKKTLSPATYLYEFSASGGQFTGKGWLSSYLCWAGVSGNLWALFLVPFLAMLAAVEVYRDRRFPAGIYTLF